MAFVSSFFGVADPVWSLTAVSVVLGICMLWSFGRLSNQEAIRRTRSRLKASLLEMRLFGDEPALVFRAQRDLLLYNLRLLALTLKPSLILALPVGLLLSYLDPFYGRTPLPLGQPALVTVHMQRPLDLSSKPTLEAPEGVDVETAAVRSLADNDVSWRIRPQRAVEGKLRFVVSGEVIEKQITTGHDRGYASAIRGSSWQDWFFYPGESKLPAGNIERITIEYPAASISWFGLELHWVWWMLILSIVTALLLKRRMGVAF